MAYDQTLANRVRTLLAGRSDLSERKMFGGITFMLGGNMCCGVVNEDLVVRTGPEGYEDAMAQPHARPMDFTGRPMKGMVFVGIDALRGDNSLRRWVERGVDFATSLPPK